ncbi:hypothetical protein PLESTB_000891300 [Pleodorina starrii]|uniref:Uncharacterized protein n=1 Tax=Pleodorina starrii TaxID=330485 RepID=A0A9W6BMC5_9CHLO|nr:hypothetical protein PLESTM_002080800 [Pleodorina starrii]GLC54648.1 hypothetical protein PLESTB_000891300 [Pleodorina starrii]GLC66987.1 hypothetical protein PLESTF_000499100 [Pleodorina starrii]
MNLLCRQTPSAARSIPRQTCCHSLWVLQRASSPRTGPFAREPRGHGVVAPQPLDSVLEADGSGDDPGRLGKHGPKLLPRPVRPKNDGNGSSKNNGGGGGGGRGGGRGPSGVGERTLASLAAYSGLVGTTALILGNLAGFDLWGEFDWTSLDDLRMAAVASVPLQLLNAALLLPSYSSPQRLPDLGNLEAMEEKLRAEQQQRQQGDQQQPQQQATAAPGVSPAAAEAAPASSAPESASASSPSPAHSAPSPPGSAAGPPGLVPADVWGRSRDGAEAKPAAEDGWTALRSALHLAQGYYISNNPTARLTPAAEAGYTFIDAAAGELLYRGVAMTWLAGWLQDRVYEAGVDETVSYQLPAAAAAAGLPGLGDAFATLGVYGACQCAVAAATATFVVLSVMSRSRRAAQRLEMLMSVASPSSSASTSARSPTGPGGRGTAGDAASGDGKAAAGRGAAGAASGAGARAAAQVLFGPGGPSVGASNAGAVMRRAAAIQAARDAFQILVLNAVFIASGGNLAASYSVSVINQLLISAMQRRGVARMRERSAALARELRAYNTQMQRIASKYKDKLPKAAATRLDTLGPEDDAAAGEAPSTSSAAGSNANSTGSSSGSEPAAAASPSAFAADSTSTSTSSSVSSGSSSSSSSSGDGRISSDGGSGGRLEEGAVQALAAGGGDIPSTGLARAIAMLDRLVPEPPKPAANNKKPRQQQPQQPQPQPQQPLQ